jgi:uncharacterized protein
MHLNEGLVRRAYAYVSLLSEDFVLRIPGRSRIAGDYAGEARLRQHFGEIAELSGGTFRTRVHAVLAWDDHVVALIDASAEREGQSISLPRVHVWTVRNGRLAELRIHPIDQQAFDNYWG